MLKKVLTEQALYFGDVSMPKGFEINNLELSQLIFKCFHDKKDFIFSKNWDKLNTYVREYINLNFKINLINKESWGDIYIPNETTELKTNVNPVDLKNSPDFTLLYGINTVDCSIKILYDDNRRKGRSWIVPLKNSAFVMFPSTNMYSIINKQKDSLNFIQTITYEYI
tara:strand:+ start:2684 stop:3187 length:504 start_codon:yes stop_codon:yes gene_type:complete